MHIEHVTHDECRRSTSTVKKAKDFLSSHIRRLSQDQNITARKSTERPVTLWPTVGRVTSNDPLEGDDTQACGASRGYHSVLRDNAADGSERLDNKRSFSRRRRKSHGESGVKVEGRTKTGYGEGRRPKDIEEEKLERATERRSAPSLSSRHDRYSTLRAKGSFGNEDATDAVSKFQPPFTPHRYAPSNAGVPVSKDTDPSQRKGITQQQRHSTESAVLNVKGKNLWRAGPLDPCRLCKERNVVGIRGLCNECENDFAGPEMGFLDSAASSVYELEEEEIRPTPPLKDEKFTTLALGNRGFERTSPGLRNGESICGAESPQEDMLEDEHRYTVYIGSEYEEPQETLWGWERRHDGGKFGSSSERAGSTANKGRREEIDAKRRASFYKFYDDVLRDHGMI